MDEPTKLPYRLVTEADGFLIPTDDAEVRPPFQRRILRMGKAHGDVIPATVYRADSTVCISPSEIQQKKDDARKVIPLRPTSPDFLFDNEKDQREYDFRGWEADQMESHGKKAAYFAGWRDSAEFQKRESRKLKAIIIALQCRAQGHRGVGLPGCRVCDPIWDEHIDLWTPSSDEESLKFGMHYPGREAIR